MNSCAYISQSKVPQSIYEMVFDDGEEITEQELRFFENIGELKEVNLSLRRFPSLSEIPSRESAINRAIQNIKSNEIVVIAGKGHETYQEYKNRKF